MSTKSYSENLKKEETTWKTMTYVEK